MPRKPRSSPPPPSSYRAQIQRPLNCLAFVAPMLVLFHLGVAVYGTDLLAPLMLGRFLRYFGAPETLLPPMLIVAVLLIQHLSRHDPWQLEGRAVAGMAGEAIVLTASLAILSRLIAPALAGAVVAAGHAPDSLPHVILRALGAGIYEEFLFRLAFIQIALLLLVDVFDVPAKVATAVAVVAAAAVFSLCHFTAGQVAPGTPFDWGRFVFLFLAGLAWGIAYVYHGFGVAVGSHVAWDLYVGLLAS